MANLLKCFATAGSNVQNEIHTSATSLCNGFVLSQVFDVNGPLKSAQTEIHKTYIIIPSAPPNALYVLMNESDTVCIMLKMNDHSH